MAEYVLQEMNDLHRDGIRRLYPRMIRMREANYDMVVNDLHEAAQVPAAHVKAVLDALPRRMMHWFSVNHSVKVDGFGLFTPNLSVVTDADVAAGDVNERNMNAENIKVSSISFRADSKLLLSAKSFNKRNKKGLIP
ncbi:MAG: hypothetical protein KBT29_06805 [Prevotellaceae bacterium]|nr:hypothetical protein [Candidatus Minthosoma caballi]